MKSDLDIAREATLIPISEIAKDIDIPQDALHSYGPYIAKIDPIKINTQPNKKSKLILVSAMSPTPAGEGKTTTTIGLADALTKLKKKALVCVREPSLGPVFGMKGGATGGGYAQAVPMENINLHFTGDLHAITSANNLLAAMIDNHIFHGNELGIDNAKISFKRCLDMNDRALRHIEISGNNLDYKTGFDITVASEIMAIFCLANSIDDLNKRLGEIEVAKNIDPKKEPILAKDIKANGAMTALLKDAFMPNLVQTLNKTPTLIHGGPFANIAHGCNSFIATKMGLDLADYVVTEAGFGADLGAEKFIDIKCRKTGISPDLVVIVATIRAIKFHGGVEKEDLNQENSEALKEGFKNLERHINNCHQQFGLNVLVAINKFKSDTEIEVKFVQDKVKDLGFEAILCEHWEKGADGAELLALAAIDLVNKPSEFKFLYKNEQSLASKIETIAKNIYHADEVIYEDKASKQLKELELKYSSFPVCIAKTPYSFSSDPALKGAASNHKLNIRELRLARGAEFIVAICGSLMTLPGLPKKPASEMIGISADGLIEGLS
ncbi:formate--tetrahydrofolate ligase [Methylophilaceae bacterium]|nr:formate--tetrahydrofolate ligase [Methylophilaceae bacterium]